MTRSGRSSRALQEPLLRFVSRLCLTIWACMASNGAVASEYWIVQKIFAETRLSFEAGDFAALEHTSRDYTARKLRTESGTWFIAAFHAVFDVEPQSEIEARDREDKHLAWIRAYPDSRTAHIAYAQSLISHAYLLRGYGFAQTVTPERWKQYFHYIGRGRDVLEASSTLSPPNPAWHVAMLEIAKSQSWSQDRYLESLASAMAEWPYYYNIYFKAVNFFMPKWGGSADEVRNFVDMTVAATQQVEGSSLYARIYWSTISYGTVRDVFRELPVEWPRMKQAYDDLLVRYPGPWNLNAYGSFACLAKDLETTRDVIARLAGRFEPAAWKAAPLERCRAWAAATGVPPGDR